MKMLAKHAMRSLIDCLWSFRPTIPLKHPSPLTLQVLALALKFTRASNSQIVTCQELLLAIVWLNQGGAFTILKEVHANLDQIYERIRKLVSGEVTPGPEGLVIPYGVDVRCSLVIGNKEAKEGRSATLQTQHILFGMLQLKDESICATLRDFGLTLKRAREIVVCDENDAVEPKHSREPPSQLG